MGDTGTGFELGHRRALDGLRAVAVLFVVACHVEQYRGEDLFQGGGIGVNIFFVLSGFLITALLIEEKRSRRDVSLRSFYVRRALRLLPALLVLVTAVAALWATHRDNLAIHKAATALPAVLFYFADIVRVRRGCGSLGFMEHTWSLSVEEQFYFVWPMVLVAATRFLGPRWRSSLLALALAGAAASALLRQLFWSDAAACRIAAGPDTQADALLLGCALALSLYVLGPRGRARIADVARWLTTPAIVGLLWFTIWLPGSGHQIWVIELPLLNVCAAVLIARLVTAPTSPLTTALSLRPAVEIGRRSYGIYLWHDACLGAVFALGYAGDRAVVAALLITAAVVWASFRFVEQPFLRLKGRFSERARGDEGEKLPVAPL